MFYLLQKLELALWEEADPRAYVNKIESLTPWAQET